MKLVIQTQIRENYAAHNGFNGEYYWKCKGGNTYVVENVNSKQAMRIGQEGIPNLSNLITEMNDYYEEYILDWSLEDDDAVVCQDWETPIMFSYDYVTKTWFASRTIDNTGEYGYMRREIKSKVETWTPTEGGGRENYQVMYDVGYWDLLSEEELSNFISEKEKEVA